MYLVFPYIHLDSEHKYMHIFFVIAINVCKSAFLVTFQSVLRVCFRNLVYPLIIYAQVLSYIIFKCKIDKRNYMQVCVQVNYIQCK